MERYYYVKIGTKKIQGKYKGKDEFAANFLFKSQTNKTEQAGKIGNKISTLREIAKTQLNITTLTSKSNTLLPSIVTT